MTVEGQEPRGQRPDAEQIDGYLRRVRTLIGRAIRRRWNEGLLAREHEGAFAGYVGADMVEHLLSSKPATLGPPLGDYEYEVSAPLGRLVQLLKLDPSTADLLALLLACDSDPVSSRLITYLSGHQAQSVLNMEMVFEIIFRDRCPLQSDAVALMNRCLSSRHPLRRLQLVLIDEYENRSALAATIRNHKRLFSWLIKDQELPAELSAMARIVRGLPAQGECDSACLKQVLTAMQTAARLVYLDGPPQSGREMLAQFAAAQLNRPLLVVDGTLLGAGRITAVFREALLQGAVLLLREADTALEGDGLKFFAECLEALPEPVLLLNASRSLSALSRLRSITTVHVTVPPYTQRLKRWRKYLGSGSAHGLAVTNEELHRLAALYNLGIAGIVNACQMAQSAANLDRSPLTREHLTSAVRQLFEQDLAGVARRVEVHQSWGDLVLPEDVGLSVFSIIDRVRYRTKVLGDWGFDRKLGKGLGLTVLFAGEPGTGKSMVASLIAAELGLDLYVIDLSKIMSKWLGETEKNLARAFDAAEVGHVLLLFDEADTVLGRRSADIKSSNDRHANLETNFILTRLEQFTGVAFFTTNMVSAVDPAVLRRLSAQIHFPFPDSQMRAELWRRLLPAEAPLADHIDFEMLADRYELSGGFIRNIVLRAAFAAARDRSAIGMQHITQAAELEYTDRGLLTVGGRLG